MRLLKYCNASADAMLLIHALDKCLLHIVPRILLWAVICHTVRMCALISHSIFRNTYWPIRLFTQCSKYPAFASPRSLPVIVVEIGLKINNILISNWAIGSSELASNYIFWWFKCGNRHQIYIPDETQSEIESFMSGEEILCQWSHPEEYGQKQESLNW